MASKQSIEKKKNYSLKSNILCDYYTLNLAFAFFKRVTVYGKKKVCNFS